MIQAQRDTNKVTFNPHNEENRICPIKNITVLVVMRRFSNETSTIF